MVDNQGFKATKIKLSDYDIMLTLGTGIFECENANFINQGLLEEFDQPKKKKPENMWHSKC